ncbi:Tyrosine recombinase XerD [Methyloligella halotolerans]|uniref:Tyrosine recombinase XerD n=1 Tax=Methyloligella halotolerans TaxID=1177755 RepID=A0A1E2RVJ4_9HYPH|nr:site-specific integrase [Methyloligella halotolerans]ODA66140.1 Tyrosine recombinase XerD [Methyloligella halotolerans]
MGDRLTRNALKKMTPGDLLWDGELKGFGARRQRETITFCLKCRVRGRQRWYSIGRLGSPWTLESARREALRLLLSIADGEEPVSRKRDKRPVTVEEGIEQFLDEHGPKLKPSTQAEYTRLCRLKIVPKLGKLKLDEDMRREVGRMHSGMASTPRQANLVLMVFSSFISWAEANELREEGKNPCRRIAKYREMKRERYLSGEELGRIGNVLARRDAAGEESPFSIAAIRLLILTGARLGEILTLKWSYVDVPRRQLRLPDSKTGAKVIRLNDAALTLLEAVPKLAGNAFVIAGEKKGSHLVNLQKSWRRIRREADLEDVRLHDLRHSYASVAAELGGSLPMIGKLLGHKHSQTTARYTHLAEDPIDFLNEQIGGRIAAALSSNLVPQKCNSPEDDRDPTCDPLRTE